MHGETCARTRIHQGNRERYLVWLRGHQAPNKNEETRGWIKIHPIYCTVRPVGGQESTKEIEKDILFGYEDIKHSTRTRRPVDGSKSIQRCVSMPLKIVEEDQTKTERPVGGQESTGGGARH